MKNPFANKNGSPKKGKEPEFLGWLREQEKKKRERMTEAERKKYDEEKKSFVKKMESAIVLPS